MMLHQMWPGESQGRNPSPSPSLSFLLLHSFSPPHFLSLPSSPSPLIIFSLHRLLSPLLPLIQSFFLLSPPPPALGRPYLQYSRDRLKLHLLRSVRSLRKTISFILDAGMCTLCHTCSCSLVLIFTRLMLCGYNVHALYLEVGMTNAAHFSLGPMPEHFNLVQTRPTSGTT